MVSKDDLLDLFERMAREKWAYKLGAAREGYVDCSGAFVFAYKQLGGPSIEHSSNSILRQSMGQLLPMRAAKPGYAAVKIRAWTSDESGNRWYNQAPGDCYHIGLVGRDGKILNAQGTKNGFVTSDPGTWAGCAPLLDVAYGEETEDENVIYQAEVTTEKDPLRVRAWAQTGRILGTVPRGAVVDVLSNSGDGWPRIRYNELVGYASGDYLTRVEKEETTDASEDEWETVDATTLVNEDGISLTLVGRWRVAED